jgi:hypothetical protein
MEDGIERSENIFYEKNNESTVKNNEKNFLYVYIPENGLWEDFIITNNREKAVKLLNNKSGRVEIFKKNFFELYKPTYDCLFTSKFTSKFKYPSIN